MRPRTLLERTTISTEATIHATVVPGDPKMATAFNLWTELRCLASFAGGMENEGAAQWKLDPEMFPLMRDSSLTQPLWGFWNISYFSAFSKPSSSINSDYDPKFKEYNVALVDLGYSPKTSWQEIEWCLLSSRVTLAMLSFANISAQITNFCN
jgi:hypothetical protein